MAGNIEQRPFINFVNEFDYSSTSIPQKHPRNERVTSSEELGTISKNNLGGISLGVRPEWRIQSLTSSFLAFTKGPVIIHVRIMGRREIIFSPQFYTQPPYD